MNDYRILVVDDEEDLCEILKFNLENEGYEVDTAHSAEEALKMDIGSYSLLLLDVMMGEISGFKMASLLKKDKKTAQVPIIFITAKDTENDTVTGFNLGADDYISKPFSMMELLARVRAHLRRAAGDGCRNAVFTFGDVTVDQARGVVLKGKDEVHLTKLEFRLLCVLIAGRGRVLTHRQLLADVWGAAYVERPHYLRLYMARLRQKLESNPTEPLYFMTETGVGYRLKV